MTVADQELVIDLLDEHYRIANIAEIQDEIININQKEIVRLKGNIRALKLEVRRAMVFMEDQDMMGYAICIVLGMIGMFIILWALFG